MTRGLGYGGEGAAPRPVSGPQVAHGPALPAGGLGSGGASGLAPANGPGGPAASAGRPLTAGPPQAGTVSPPAAATKEANTRPGAGTQTPAPTAIGKAGADGSPLPDWTQRIPTAWWVVGLILLVIPAFAGNFWMFQVFGWTFIIGMIALSLMFLAGYGGMVSLVQMTVAAVGGYMVAILGTSGVESISLGMPWWLHIPLAILIAAVFGTLIGALAVRTEGIYTIMITLAIASAFFYFTRQNYGIFNGYTGFNLVVPPQLFGVDWRQPMPFYYLTMVLAVLSWLLVVYVSRSPFGLALQGVRDNPRRMAALGFNVTAHRIAAYTFASCIAAVGGILLVWQNAMISPGTAGIPAVIDILVIAVVGGVRRPIGPFIGALIYVLLRTFSPDVLTAFGLSNERFKLLIGMGFLLVVFFSPDGVLGLWDRWKAKRGKRDPLTGKELG